MARRGPSRCARPLTAVAVRTTTAVGATLAEVLASVCSRGGFEGLECLHDLRCRDAGAGDELPPLFRAEAKNARKDRRRERLGGFANP